MSSTPVLLVSILGGAIAHASIRQRLRAALTALDHVQDEGVLHLDDAGGVEFASASAQENPSDLPEQSAVRLPEQLALWHANALGTLIISTDGLTLLVESTDDGSARLLGEQPSCMEKLTAREREVMRGVEDGLSNAEIARRLWIQPTTVRKHLENVFAKLGVRSRTAALSKLHAPEAKAS
jgi:DNA-binding CsgD family transcriptional regulator